MFNGSCACKNAVFLPFPKNPILSTLWETSTSAWKIASSGFCGGGGADCWKPPPLKELKDPYKVSQNGSAQAVRLCHSGQEVTSSACEVEQLLPQSKRENKILESSDEFSLLRVNAGIQEQWPHLTRVKPAFTTALHAQSRNNGPFSELPNQS